MRTSHYRMTWIVLLAGVLLAGCKDRRQMGETISTVDGSAIQQAIEKADTSNTAELPHYLQANFTCEVNGIKVRCQARMCSDSIIWVNANKIVDLGRAILTPDSVKVYVGVNNSYFTCDYPYFRQKFGIETDYTALQGMLIEHTARPTSLTVPIRSSQLNADAHFKFDAATRPTKLNFPFSIPRSAQRMSMEMFK